MENTALVQNNLWLNKLEMQSAMFVNLQVFTFKLNSEWIALAPQLTYKF